MTETEAITSDPTDSVYEATAQLGEKIEAAGKVQALEVHHGALTIAEALRSLGSHLSSPNELDTNLEAANVVDGLYFIGRAINRLAAALEAEP